MEPTPVFKKKRGISPVWTLPILAFAICIWIVFTSYKNAGITVDIYFADATGIVAGKTQVISRGVPIGTVARLVPDLENRRIKTVVKMDKSVKDLLVEDTQFWIVRPEISAASVQGLDTLFSGSYIGFQPGTSAIAAVEFTGSSSPPPIPKETPGLHIKLRATELGSIESGSGIYFRNLSIGSVTKHILAKDDDAVIIDLYIKPEYAHLVREGSRFYNASGVSISGKLTNLDVHIESLSSLLKGGIVLITPEALAQTKQVKNGHIFKLYKDLDSASYGIEMTLQLASSLGITEGETKLVYRGLVAGVVEKIDFNDDERHTVTAHIMLDPRAERILRQGTRFWIVRPEITLGEIKNLDILLSGPYITFIPGEGPFQNHFEILPEPPPQIPLRPGSKLLLSASDSYSIDKGAPLKYKGKKVGEVLDVEINSTTNSFDFLVYIYKQYEKLVQPSSVFWSDGGFLFDASLSGIQLKSDSIKAMFQGGISFITPDGKADFQAGQQTDHQYQLYKNYTTAVAQSPFLKPDGYYFQLKTADPEPFKVGTPIFYKKIAVGEITGFQLEEDNETVLIDCLIQQNYADTVNATTQFYNNSGISIDASLSGLSVETKPLQALIQGGISYYTPQQHASRNNNGVFPLYASKKEAKLTDTREIQVIFKECEGLRPGSPVKYKGVDLGTVTDLTFADNMKDIMVHLRIDKEAEPLFRNNTQLWLEKTEVSLAGIKNLKSVLFGSFISIMPGSGELQRNFTALTEPPSIPANIMGGLNVILVSKHLGSLKVNSPVYYRQIQIGRVVSFSLAANFKSVHVLINIEEPYRPIIRANTKFWVASGARISGGLFSGVSIATESLEALLTGGIALATPESPNMGAPVTSNYHFILHEKVEAEWLDWQPDITLVEKEKHVKDDI